MGLGKTFIGSEKMKNIGAKVNLVICQKSKVDDWFSHMFDNYHDKFEIYDLTMAGAITSFLADAESYTYKCIGIINYDLVWRRKELLKLHDFTLMLDESSLITNPTANRSKFILNMAPSNVILLSGTPTAGKYEKLWSQLQLLGWNIDEDTFFKSYVDYKWVDRDGYWDKQILGYKNVDHLKRKLAKYGAIFKKTEEVIDLPEQVEQIINLEPDKKYKQFQKNHYISMWQGPEREPIELIGDTVLTKILYERQLCGQYLTDKLEAFKDIVESTEDRLVVFYNFNEELERLKRICVDLKKPVSVINGRGKVFYAYEECDNSITLVQYQAGAYGLNLQKANRVIYFTLPLGIGSCDLWEQSKKRIHRIGQDRTCFYYYLIVKNSIETWNFDLLKKGKELTDDLFEKEEIR
jgi:SNF2 family DNA or RNA helicase